MNELDFVIYQKFADKYDAVALSELLAQNNIAFELEDTTPGFDPSFTNNEVTNEYRVKLRKEDFEKADNVQAALWAKEIATLGRDYYLYEFTDQELIDLLKKPDEWGKFDYLLAQKILTDRGKHVSKESLNSFQRQRSEDLAEPEKSQKIWIVAGYIAALMGGIIGIFMGWQLVAYKKTLPNGDRVYGYSHKDRKHGIWIIGLGIIALLTYIISGLLATI